jgi:hypothetical protein
LGALARKGFVDVTGQVDGADGYRSYTGLALFGWTYVREVERGEEDISFPVSYPRRLAGLWADIAPALLGHKIDGEGRRLLNAFELGHYWDTQVLGRS